MKPILVLAAAALALVHAGSPAGAASDAPLGDRFSTEVVLAPGLMPGAPTSPSYVLGVGRIDDAYGAPLDPMTTGQIAEPDAEKAAEGASPDGGVPVQPEPAAAPEAATVAETTPPPGSEEGKGEAWASVRSPMPFDIIRTIQFLQDQVARGNGRAIQVQAMLLRRFGPVFVEADPKVWSDGRNLRAAVLFVLSGGPPAVLRHLMDTGVVEERHQPLVKGALAYVENRLSEAEELLTRVDYTDMEPGLEAHLNLVLGQVKQLTKKKEAVAHLDRARLLAPGGLIEEAALRMEMLIVDGLGDHVTADRLARQYFDRFSRSSYSANFEARFAAVYASRGKMDAAGARATMLDVTERLPAANRRTIYLAVARRTLIEGNLAFAALVAESALETDGISDAERQRAKLYVLAATIGASGTPDPATSLAAIDRAELRPEDTVLLDAASSVVDGIDRTPGPPENPAASEQYAESSPVFDRAQQLLNEVDADLGKVRP